MKLYWSSRSPYVRKVMVVAHELGLADQIEAIPTQVATDQLNPALLADNPLNKIPTLLLEDGTPVYDSLTICEVLNHRAGGGLFPPPGPARWAVLTRQALGHGLLDALLLWRFERGKEAGRQTESLLESLSRKTQGTLDRLDRLAPALAATPLDIGHITVAVALSYLDFRFADLTWRQNRSALLAWHADFATRPSMQATEARLA